MIERARKRLSKRAKRGFRGWPLATVALYGPNDTMATKLTVGILPSEEPKIIAPLGEFASIFFCFGEMP